VSSARNSESAAITPKKRRENGNECHPLSDTVCRDGGTTGNFKRISEEAEALSPRGFTGMWVTGDGHIRHELLPNGRYDKQRVKRKSAYQSCYTTSGNHIDCVDDAGFTAAGNFVDGALHHAGVILYREQS
jgi:hypothetical protein